MKIKIVKKYVDKETLERKEPGDSFEVKDARAKELIKAGYAIAVEKSKPSDKSQKQKSEDDAPEDRGE